MRLLLLVAAGADDSGEALPLGAASVAAAILAEPALSGALEPRLLDAPFGAEAEELARRVLAARPALVGLSVYSWNRGMLSRLARSLREASPGLLLFAGGPEASADPAGLLAGAPLDFVVIGEGEGPATAALLALDRAGWDMSSARGALASIPGLALRGAPGEAAPPFRRAPAPDPATLPSPWIAGLVDPSRRGSALWELARGCPFRCTYCYESKGEAGVRPFARDRVEAELALFAAAAPLEVFVLDPTFNADRGRALALLSLLAERGAGLRWKFEVRAEFLDRSLARAFARLDCSLQIGLQSADPAVLAGIGRPGFDPAAFARKLALLDAEGVAWGLDLIYGLPGDDPAGFARSLDFALGLAPNHLDAFRLAVLPGTELADRAGELGLAAMAEAPHLLLSSPGFTPEALAEAGRLAAAAEEFYSRGRAVSWFLRALKPLKARPAAFLSSYARAFPGPSGEGGRAAGGHAAIEARQLAFLEAEYAARGLARVFDALRDTVMLEGALSRALAEGEGSELSLRLDPGELLGPGALDLAGLARSAVPAPGRWRVAPGPKGPRIERAGGGTRRRR